VKQLRKTYPRFLPQYTSPYICINFTMSKCHDMARHTQPYPNTQWLQIEVVFVPFFLNKKFGVLQRSHAGRDQQARERKRTIHDQTISRFYTTLINLSPIAYRRRVEKTMMTKLLSLLRPGAIRRTTSNRRRDPQ
jgi:hypothetical protein